MKERFFPEFSGCVLGDFRTVKAVERLCREELEQIATYLYREVLLEGDDSALGEVFEAQAREAAYHFRFLGRLLLALGGDFSLRMQLRMQRNSQKTDERRSVQDLLYVSLCEKRQLCAMYRSVIEDCSDGVVRSALTCILENEERLEEQFQHFFG